MKFGRLIKYSTIAILCFFSFGSLKPVAQKNLSPCEEINILGKKLAQDIYSDNKNSAVTTIECRTDTLYIKKMFASELRITGLVKDRMDHYLPIEKIGTIQTSLFSAGTFYFLSKDDQNSFETHSFSSNTLKYTGSDQNVTRIAVHFNSRGVEQVNEQEDIEKLKHLIQQLNPQIVLE